MKVLLRVTLLLGIALLGYLLTTVRFSALTANAKVIGWGLLLVIALGGLSHVVKTWAWRLTLQHEARNVPFGRTLALRLISEAIGQFGFIGMVGGEATRVSLLGSGASLSNAISSVALDRSLFILAGAVVTIAGMAGLVFVVSLSHSLYLYAGALVLTLLTLLLAGGIAIHRKLPVLSRLTHSAGRLPWFRKWLADKESTIAASERRILDFYHHTPRAFWLSVLLNFVCHFLAILEVFICLRILGAHATIAGALILESLTKLINVAGAVNPGNVGTYEAGNMAIGKIVHMTRTQGLMLALCRRTRAIFWAVIGGICLIWISKKRQREGAVVTTNDESITTNLPAELSLRSLSLCEAVFLLAHDLPREGQFEPALARLATLPVLLRTMLGVRGKERVRTVLVLDPANRSSVLTELIATGRVPADVEWMETPPGTALSTILRDGGLSGGRIAFVSAGCNYHPNLLRALHDWDGEGGALGFVSSGSPIGLVALAPDIAARLAADSKSTAANIGDLHGWIAENLDVHVPGTYPFKEVDDACWQSITGPDECKLAEEKLTRWLVKPTDGVFARMNRRVSIPISRQLIKFPISPNMVSLFTLALSLAAGVCFAAGGYWNCLIGAVLGVLTSILDGCDGEVARLKLQASDFGCWVDSACDYIYYIVTFVGITIGLVRTSGQPSFAGWGMVTFAGAFMTFILAGIGRKRLSGNRPEQYLQVWQRSAERRSAGFLIRMARHTEFIVRRCFLPYLLLVTALLNGMNVFIYMAAFGANVAWIISLRSLVSFSVRSNSAAVEAEA